MPSAHEAASDRFSARYADTVNDALERVACHGPLWGPGFAYHAPMAAEALAALGYYDEVPRWIERHGTVRAQLPIPDAKESLIGAAPAEQDAALGDFARFTDWTQLFETELREAPWRTVLERWWPRLLTGMSGILGHGVIRAAHAARSLSVVSDPTAAQLHELAQGLALWAACHATPPVPAAFGPLADAPQQPEPEEVRPALVAATASVAGMLADCEPSPTIPVMHAVTIPMAVDIVLPLLPLSLHQQTYHHALATSSVLLHRFSAHLAPASAAPVHRVAPSLAAGIEAAVETGDEHAIKMAEVCVRSVAAHPGDESYLRAVSMLVHQLGEGRAWPRRSPTGQPPPA
ncbi:hypothetical protein P8605_29130 [Streptomyces sp. T-3]|nr:hypothetical protein [Streptomyces sp. T-3]